MSKIASGRFRFELGLRFGRPKNIHVRLFGCSVVPSTLDEVAKIRPSYPMTGAR
jgi:hypothetical protein